MRVVKVEVVIMTHFLRNNIQCFIEYKEKEIPTAWMILTLLILEFQLFNKQLINN